MKCYLADLVYDTINDNYAIPLGIGYLAAYLEKCFDKKLEIKLFKYPSDLERAIKEEPPDLLGLSNYSWNQRLSLLFCEVAKSVNSSIVTVMGGPNIRLAPKDIHKFLKENKYLDYYIMFEGEKPLANLVGKLLDGEDKSCPDGCAVIKNGMFHYKPLELESNLNDIDLPSPYLTGWLDPFLKNPKMIPVLETNRGCPYSCVYCVWGISALSKVRIRNLDIVQKEIDYISQKSTGQPNWFICDANFGIFPRDIEISQKIRQTRDETGFPVNVIILDSKNITQRNLEISRLLGNDMQNNSLIALQSSDKKVLELSGRGNIKFENLIEKINDYRSQNMEIRTDILIGLPGESYDSHLNTLYKSFELGFDVISASNIRLLQGSNYETDEYREKYKIITKFRPIFGAYGKYDGKIVFETEESIYGTKDMPQNEYDSFKPLHWLIYFTWNTGIFKPVLKLGQKYGINPVKVLLAVSETSHPKLRKMFDQLLKESSEEWFEKKEDMIKYYSKENNFNSLINNFMKLNSKYIAIVYKDRDFFDAVKTEIFSVIWNDLRNNNNALYNLEKLLELTDLIFCRDLLQDEFSIKIKISGEIASIIFHDATLEEKEYVHINVYRPRKYVSICRNYLEYGFSTRDLTKFIQDGLGGLNYLKNKVSLCV